MGRKRCPCPKACHPTLLAAFTQRAKLRDQRGYVLRAYYCGKCRHYHLTSKPARLRIGTWPSAPAGVA